METKTNMKVIFLIAIFANALAQPIIRIAHASPDAPKVDVLEDGFLIFASVAFRQVTAYEPSLKAYNDLLNLLVVPSGANAPIVINATVPLVDGTPYTIAAVGKLANIQPLVLIDDLRAPYQGNAAVRFVHLSPNAPNVDIVVPGGVVIGSNVAFKSATAYIQIPAGTYTFEVRVAGTETVVLNVPASLNSSSIYTIFAEGLVGGNAVTALRALVQYDSL